MLATRSHVHQLLEEALRTPVDRNAARALVTALFDPSTPPLISEFLQSRNAEDAWETIPRHLGFGMLDEALDHRAEPHRALVTKKLFRRLEQIAVALDDVDRAMALCGQTEHTFNDLYRGYVASEDLLRSDTVSSAALTCLAEQILIVLASHRQLFSRLLMDRFSLDANPRRFAFAARVREAAVLGTQSWADSRIHSSASQGSEKQGAGSQASESKEGMDWPAICANLDEPVPFRMQLLKDAAFQTTLQDLDIILDELIPPQRWLPHDANPRRS